MNISKTGGLYAKFRSKSAVASVELPDQGDNIIRTHDLDNSPNPKGLGHELFWCMKRHGKDIAQIDAETGRRDTYEELLSRCIRTATEMRRRGVTTDDVITPCTHNQMDSCVPFIAALFLGAKVASLDPNLGFADIKHLLRQVHPKMIFLVPESEVDVETALRELSLDSEIVSFGPSDRNAEFSQFLQDSSEEGSFAPVEAKSVYDTAVIFFSSGVTGLPKGICTSHYSLLSQMGRYRTEKTLVVQLLFYSLYGLSGGGSIVTSVLIGTTRIVCRKFDAEEIWKHIEDFGVTSTFLAPVDAITLLKTGRPDGVDTSSLKIVTVGSGTISSTHLVAMKDFFPDSLIVFPYGQTEVAGSLTSFAFTKEDMDLMMRKGNSVGRPLRGFWYKIVDTDTEESLGPNQKGELRVKTKLQMNGYHEQDSSAAFDSDGWLRTGDVCYYDDDHCFFVVDRIKEMFKYRNRHVTPAMLEGVLLQHPAVKLAVVIGMPHDEDGDRPLGLVVLSKDAGNVTQEELVDYVAERVHDKQRLRAGVRFIEDVPYTPTGKVRRNVLRQRVLLNK